MATRFVAFDASKMKHAVARALSLEGEHERLGHELIKE
jgi:hypothetical protein